MLPEVKVILAISDFGFFLPEILQQKKPDDFVISTDKQYSVKYFFELCCNILEIKISWSGKKFNEIAKVLSFNNQKTPSIKKNMIILKIIKKYFRPNEVSNLIGNSNKAKKKFNWKSRYTIQQIAKEMIEADYNSEKNKFIRRITDNKNTGKFANALIQEVDRYGTIKKILVKEILSQRPHLFKPSMTDLEKRKSADNSAKILY